jgi:hypothetical protein
MNLLTTLASALLPLALLCKPLPTRTTGTITLHQTIFQATLHTRHPIDFTLTTLTYFLAYDDPIVTETSVTATATLPLPFVGDVTMVNGQVCRVSSMTRTRTSWSTVTVYATSITADSGVKMMDEFEQIWSLLDVKRKGTFWNVL